jgi:hypothetical protein
MNRTDLRRIGFNAICISLLLASVFTSNVLSDSVDGQLVTGDLISGQYGPEFEPLPGANIWLFSVGNPIPVANAVSDQDGLFEMNTTVDFDIICPYSPGRSFDPVWSSKAAVGKRTTIMAWTGFDSSESSYLVYVLAVTPGRNYIDGADVTFSGEYIGTKMAETISPRVVGGLYIDGTSSILTFTPEIPGSGENQVRLSGPVNISVSKPGWTFEPSLVQVEGSRIVMFVGTNTSTVAPADMEVNVNRVGMDYDDFDLPSPNPALCRDACVNDPNCRACTYVRPGYQGSIARCWLKDDVPTAEPGECCISWVKP